MCVGGGGGFVCEGNRSKKGGEGRQDLIVGRE